MLPSERDLSGLRLRVSADGRRLDVRDRGSVVATVDTRSFHVSEPSAAAATVSPRRPITRSTDAGGSPWAALVLVAAGLSALAVVVARRRVHPG